MTHMRWNIILLLLVIAAVVFSATTHGNSLQKGVTAAAAAYDEKIPAAAEDAYNMFYESNYEMAEEKYHVSNEVSITLGEVKEIAKLEVLEVSMTEYVIADPDDNEAKIAAWLEVPGTGVYTVDLSVAEYLVDSVRNKVTVRIPTPVLEDVRLDENGVKLLHFENTDQCWFFGIGNDDARTGAELYRQQRLEAYVNISARFMSDTEYIDTAKRSAEKIITHLIKEFNHEIPELEIVVEFIS